MAENKFSIHQPLFDILLFSEQILIFLYTIKIIEYLVYEPLRTILTYPVNSAIRQYLKIIFIITQIKIFLVDFTILFYIFFPIIKEKITSLLTLNEDHFLNTLFILSFILFLILTILKQIEKELQKTDYEKQANQLFDSDIHLKFSEKEIEKIIYEIPQIQSFYLSLIEKNIKNIEQKTIGYKVFTQKEFSSHFPDAPQTVIDEQILSLHYLSFNEIYEKTIFQKIKKIKEGACPFSSLYDWLKNNQIIAIYPFYVNKKISSYTVLIENDTVSFLSNKTIYKIKKIHEHIEYFLENIINHEAYITSNYKKNIASKNIQEKNEQYINNLKQTKELIHESSFFVLHEKNKKKILITNYKKTESKKKLEDFLFEYYKESPTQKKQFQNKYIFFSNENKSLPIMVTKKIQSDKKSISFAMSLPFLDKNLQLINNFFYKKIEEELFLSSNEFILEKNILCEIYDSFEIKIIIGGITQTESFLKTVEHFGQHANYKTIFISLKNIDDMAYQKIDSYYDYLNTLTTPHVILLQDIDTQNKYFQKIIIEKHITLFSQKTAIKNKMILFLPDQTKISTVNPVLYKISKIILTNPTPIHSVEKKSMHQVIINYFSHVIKKNITIEEIEKIIEKLALIEEKSIYKLIDIICRQLIIQTEEDNIEGSAKYIKESILLQKEALKNDLLMKKLNKIFKENYTKIAKLLGVHKSTISRYYKKQNSNFL